MKFFTANEVAQHNSAESCWVVLYGHVYDVTSFLSQHPGGSKIIISLAGQDATEEYDPVHPPGTLEENLSPEAKLGKIDADGVIEHETPIDTSPSEQDGPVDLQSLLNLDEIEAVATKNISKKAWAYYYSASDDLYSKSFNNAAYRSIVLRPRVFVDCTECSTATTFFGHPVRTPVYISPAAMARLAHPSGEAGIASACAGFGACQIISQNASMTPEQIVSDAQSGQIFGWQLYVQTDRAKSEAMLARINKLSDRIKFVVLTLDAPVPGKREDDERTKTAGASPSKNMPMAAVSTNDKASAAGGPKSGGLGAALFWGTAANLKWDTTLPWLAKHTTLPIVLKGIQTHEDACMAQQHAPQVRGIILSNHGGRALDTAPPAVHTLLEIRKYCPEVLSGLEVYVDGGIRRGTDVVKALCLGARGVGIGRAALWGLGAGGPDGVARALQILQEELETAVRLLGVKDISQLGVRHLNTRAAEQLVYDGPATVENLSVWMSSKL